MAFTNKKAQTATEYLIILAVVIVIALIVIGVLGGIPSIGGETSKSTDSLILKNEKIGVENFYINSTFAKLKIKNNNPFLVSITNITIDGNTCSISSFNLKIGESKLVNCTGTFTDYSDGKQVPNIKFIWIDLSNAATYETKGLGITSSSSVSSVEQSFTVCDNSDAGGYFYRGDGSSNSPYGICNCSMMQDMSNDLSANYELLQDIDCDVSPYNSGNGFTPIGNETDPFTGTFNGNHFTISDLRTSWTSQVGVGLFGIIDGSTLYNIRFSEPYMNGKSRIGALVGVAQNSDIQNILVELTSLSIGAFEQGSVLAGIVGFVNKSTIDSCVVKGDFSTGSVGAGGIVGEFVEGTVSNSYFVGDTSAGREGAGGISGYYSSSRGRDIEIINSFSFGNIYAAYGGYAGGLVGTWGDPGSSGRIDSSFALGQVTGSNPSTLFYGMAGDLTYDNSYFVNSETNIQGTLEAGGVNAFKDSEHAVYTDWDFTNIWGIDPAINNGLPYLRFELITP